MSLCDAEGEEIGRGLVNYTSTEVDTIKVGSMGWPGEMAAANHISKYIALLWSGVLELAWHLSMSIARAEMRACRPLPLCRHPATVQLKHALVLVCAAPPARPPATPYPTTHIPVPTHVPSPTTPHSPGLNPQTHPPIHTHTGQSHT